MIFSLLTLWTNVALSQPQNAEVTAQPSFEENFKEGVKLYQSKDFNKALTSFETALKENPHNISLLTNLGLVSFELGKKGLALGFLRRALELDTDFRPAEQAYTYVWSQLEVKELPHRIETYETIRAYFLKQIHLSSFLFLGGLCFFLSGWLLIRYFSQRKKALEEELPLPPFPSVATVLSLFFVGLFILSVLKAYDLTLNRATIVAEKVLMYTAPSENETSLFELSQGLEVIVRKSEADWLQVTYPGGPTGWIKKAELMTTTMGSF